MKVRGGPTTGLRVSLSGGSPGRLRCDTFDSESQAREAERRNVRLCIRHGYYFANE